jgi:hypothetical protein
MESPHPDMLMSPMCCRSTCPISPGPTLLRSLPHKIGEPSSSFFLPGWLCCHSNRSGRSCLRTLQVPEIVSPLWHHRQVCPVWSDQISTPSMVPLPPVSSHLCGSFLARSSGLGIAFFLHVPSSVIQSWTGMTFLSCSKELPIWNPHFGG